MFCYVFYNRGVTLNAFIVAYHAMLHHFRMYGINTTRFSMLIVHCWPRSHTGSRTPHRQPKKTQCSKNRELFDCTFGSAKFIQMADVFRYSVQEYFSVQPIRYYHLTPPMSWTYEVNIVDNVWSAHLKRAKMHNFYALLIFFRLPLHNAS